MNERQKRLIEVYEYLRMYYGIHTKTGFAEALGYGRTSMSAAFSGKQNYLTDSLFQSICQKWEGVFNLDYLLTGKGKLLLAQVGVSNQPEPTKESAEVRYIDNDSILNALLSAKDETIYALKQQLATKDEIIQAKDDVIAGLRQQLKTLRSQMEQTELKTELSGYPFPMGAAETERDYKRK